MRISIVKLLRLMDAAGIRTFAELSRRSGVSTDTIRALLYGSTSPRWHTVQALTQALKCSMESFVREE